MDSGRIPASVCQLEHRSVSSGSFCGPESLFTADGGDGFGTDGPSFISTLYATASPRLNGMLVECFGPDGVNLEPYNLVGSGTVQIIGILYNNFFPSLMHVHIYEGAVILVSSSLGFPFLDKNQKRKAWVDLHMIHATMMSLEAFVAQSALLSPVYTY